MFLQSVDGRCSMQMSAECYCFSNPSMSVLCADVCGLLLFQRSVVEHCSVEMSADCYCFSCRTSSVALCIVSAVRSRALLCAVVCGLLLFQQSEVERCSRRCLRAAIVSAVRSRASSVQLSADWYSFSRPVQSALCPDVCGSLLFQQSDVERCSVPDVCCLLLFQQSNVEPCSVQSPTDPYCFSSRHSIPLQSSTSSGGRVVRR